MTGEELLDYVRYRVADHGLDNYIQLNRALREYCQQAGFDWLREVNGAAVLFEADRTEYPLGELGLRSIRAVYYQDSTSSEWKPMDERRGFRFEESVREFTDDDGNVSDDPPAFYELYGESQHILRIGPKPAQTYQGRIDGIAKTPVVSRLDELPGPDEYHYLIGDIATGYVLEHEGMVRLKTAASESEFMVASALQSKGMSVAATAISLCERVVRDSMPNRLPKLKITKQPLMR